MKYQTSTRRAFAAAVLSAAMVIPLAACTGEPESGDPGSGEVELVDFRLFATPVTHDAQAYMALEQGFFEEEGLNVVIQSFPSGTTALESFKQGIDGREGFGDAIISGGTPAISFWDQSDDKYRALAAVEQDSAGYIAMAREGIDEAEDLVGQKVGYRERSTSELFLRSYLDAHGLSMDDIEPVNLDQAAMVSALDRGDIAAFFLFEPAGRLSVETSSDSVHYLTTGEGYFLGTTVIGTWTHVIDERADDLAALMRALIKGQEYAQAHPEEVAALYERDFQLKPEYVLADLEIFDLNINLQDDFISATEDQAAVISGWGGLVNKFDFWSFASPCVLAGVDPSRVASSAPSC